MWGFNTFQIIVLAGLAGVFLFQIIFFIMIICKCKCRCKCSYHHAAPVAVREVRIEEKKQTVKKSAPKPVRKVKKENLEKQERLDNLGEKIERQRQRAEKRTDTINDRNDTPYSAKTRAAVASANDTISQMDDLQRRVEVLRKNAVKKETDVQITGVSTSKSTLEYGKITTKKG